MVLNTKLMLLFSLLTLSIGLSAAADVTAQVAGEPTTGDVQPDPSKERLKNLDEQLETLQQSQAADRKRIEELEKELARQKKEKEEAAKKKEGGKKATILGFYAASMTSTFSEKAPLDFSLNEMEVDVGANATDWLEFRADLQVRTEAADPEENRHAETSESNPVDMLYGRRLLDNIAEQGYMAISLYKPMDLKIHVGKFNSQFSMDPFDQVDGNLISHSLTNLHGIVRSLTGAKVGLSPIPEVRLEVVAAEGWNINLDNNGVPSVGGQVRLNLPGSLEAGVSGYYGKDVAGASTDPSGTFQDSDVPRAAISGFARVTAFPGWKIAAEGCWGTQEVTIGTGDTATKRDENWFGGSIKVDHEPASWFTLALRYEIFGDDKGTILPTAVVFPTGVQLHGPAVGARIKIAGQVYLMTELNAKFSNEDVLTKPNGDFGQYELFFGSQLLFRFGDVPDDGKKSIADVMTGS
jgi:hypothetical protein